MSHDRTRSNWWFDAHLDLACLAVEGRDLKATLSEAVGPPHPASITLPSLRDGRVRIACATIFTAPDPSDACGYPPGDVDAAFEAGRRQLEIYETLEREGQIRIVRRSTDLDLNEEDTALRVILLMEGADPIGSPDDVAWWRERGLRAVGLTWARGTRYAGGNANPGPLTDAGMELIRALDDASIVHDLSHLPDIAARQLLEQASGPVMASHSNARSLIDGENQRHLPDDLIRAIGERGGVIGLNLYSAFLVPGAEKRRATIAEAVDHVEYVSELMDHRNGAGLGSDADGGFGADRMPEGIDIPADFDRLADELGRRGWSDDEIHGFRRGNWERFFRRSLFS